MGWSHPVNVCQGIMSKTLSSTEADLSLKISDLVHNLLTLKSGEKTKMVSGHYN
jgi:hypothetical protein